MDWLIQDAMAQGAGSEGSLIGLLPLVLIFVVFYFLLIRPQSKRQKEHKAMVASLNIDDEIVTGGGVLGRVTKIHDQFVSVEVASGVELKIQRHTIGAVMPKGTVKSIK